MTIKEQQIASITLKSLTSKDEWQKVKLGDIAYEVSDRIDNPSKSGLDRFVGLEHFESGEFNIKRWGSTKDVTSAMKLFIAGDILFARRNAYLKRASMASFDGVCSGDAIVLREKHEIIVEGFLVLILNTEDLWEHAISNAAGSMSKRVKWRDLAEYQFSLPPKDEQRRIADILWAADENLCRAEVCIQATLSLRYALLNHLLESGSVSSNWPEVQFGTLMIGSHRSGYSAVSAGRDTGRYVLALSALSHSGYQKGYLKPVEFTDEIKGTSLKRGDFLISRSNTIELVGLVGIFDEDREDVSFPDTMMLINVDEKKIDKRFLEQVLLSKFGRSQMRRIAAGTSASMKKINRKGLSSLIIPLPSLDKQRYILKQLNTCASAVHSAESRRDSCRRLKDALLKRLLANGF